MRRIARSKVAPERRADKSPLGSTKWPNRGQHLNDDSERPSEGRDLRVSPFVFFCSGSGRQQDRELQRQHLGAL